VHVYSRYCTEVSLPAQSTLIRLVHSFNIATTVEPAADAAAKRGGKGKLLEGQPFPLKMAGI
jgi:hypothetical protein